MALDLDGTLLDGKGTLSEDAAGILRTLTGIGVRIILASGRMTARVMPFASQLGIPMSILAYNGAEILEGRPGHWDTVSLQVLPDQARIAVFELCRTHRVFLNVYSEGKLYGYHADGDFSWSRHYETSSGSTYADKTDNLAALPQTAIKVLVIDTFQNRERLSLEWSGRLSRLCDMTKSNPEYLEFLAPGVSKGTGLEIWLRRASLQAANLMAFGDAENDLEMLRLAGLGIGMANATPGLRASYTRFSAFTNAQNGVAQELRAHFRL